MPEHIQIQDGTIDFATYAIKDVTTGSDAYGRLRAPTGDALVVSRLSLSERPDATPNDHWA